MVEIGGLGELVAYAQEQVERVERMRTELADASAEAWSPGRFVFARTGAGGALLELRIDPAVRRLPTDELTAEVSAAITAAQRKMAERADAIMAPVLGTRPSERSLADLEAGMGQLEALADDLDRLAARRDLSG
jgi:DNA-binding protein YbaB